MASYERIVFIGAGNLAWHTALAFYKKGIKIEQIFSRQIENAKILAQQINASYTNKLDSILANGTIYILCVPDDEIDNLVTNKYLKALINNRLTLHTAGSVEMNKLYALSENRGVFYPLQTFSKQKKVDFKHIPICIEGNTKENLDKIENLALKLSPTIYKINSKQRALLHLSAVFACNFTNYMFTISEMLLSSHALPFDILKPLVLETTKKAFQNNPSKSQTGPAIRGDRKTLEKHILALEKYPELQEIYINLSQNIAKLNNKHYI